MDAGSSKTDFPKQHGSEGNRFPQEHLIPRSKKISSISDVRIYVSTIT